MQEAPVFGCPHCMIFQVNFILVRLRVNGSTLSYETVVRMSYQLQQPLDIAFPLSDSVRSLWPSAGIGDFCIKDWCLLWELCREHQVLLHMMMFHTQCTDFHILNTQTS